MNILIADDDPISRRLLQNYLQKWGYEVTTAGDGAEAWRLFEGGSFPMVITDWMMPELDGSGLLRRIRSSPRPGYVYAILLTAKSQKEDLVEGMDAGADDFLTKPFDRDELRVRLARASGSSASSTTCARPRPPWFRRSNLRAWAASRRAWPTRSTIRSPT